MVIPHLLSLLCVGNLGKNAHNMAAIDSGRVLSVYLSYTEQQVHKLYSEIINLFLP